MSDEDCVPQLRAVEVPKQVSEMRRQAEDSFEKLGEVCDEDSPLTSTPEEKVEVADEKHSAQQLKGKTSVNFNSLVSRINKRNSPRLISRVLSPALPIRVTPVKTQLAVAPNVKQGFYSPRITTAKLSASKLPHRPEGVKLNCPFAFTSRPYPAPSPQRPGAQAKTLTGLRGI